MAQGGSGDGTQGSASGTQRAGWVYARNARQHPTHAVPRGLARSGPVSGPRTSRFEINQSINHPCIPLLHSHLYCNDERCTYDILKAIIRFRGCEGEPLLSADLDARLQC